MIRRTLLVPCFLFATAAAGADKPVAELSGQTIKESEVEQYYKHLGETYTKRYADANQKAPMVQQYTDSKMLEQLGEKAKLHETESFKRSMAYARMVNLGKVFIEKHLNDKLSDDVLKKAFAKNPSAYSTREVRVSSIATGKKRLAGELAGRVTKDKFAKFAMVHSEDQSTKKQGGDMGFVRRGMFKKEIEEKLFSMKKDEITKTPIVDSNINYIFMVTDVRGSDNPKFESVRDFVYQAERSKLLASEIKEFRNQTKQKILVKAPSKKKK